MGDNRTNDIRLFHTRQLCRHYLSESILSLSRYFLYSMFEETHQFELIIDEFDKEESKN